MDCSNRERVLQVAVDWGRVALAVRHFRPGEPVMLGPGSSLDVPGLELPESPWALAVPVDPGGLVLRLASGLTLPPGGRAELMLGQVRITLAWQEAARPARTARAGGRDPAGTTWLLSLLVLALGLWGMIQVTPETAREADEYLRSPARYASLVTPRSPDRARPRFEQLRTPEPPSQAPRPAAVPARRPGARPDRVLAPEERRQRDHRAAVDAGILRWLRDRDGGGQGGTVFSGSRPADLDSQLEGLAGPAGAGSDGWGGVGLRGGPGGPRDLGLGGSSHGNPWGPGGPEQALVRIPRRGKGDVKVDGRTRTRIVGGLTQSVVGETMQRHWSQFKYCYERQLSREPNLRGKVVASFTIGPRGRVEEASVLQSTAQSPDLEACLLRSLRHLLFPAPRGGGEVIVTYPFLFSTVE